MTALAKCSPQRTLGRHARRGQALVEFAMAAPVVLLLFFGLLGAARVTGATLGVIATAREAARVAARAPDADTAWQWGVQTNGSLQLDVDTSSFGIGGEVRVAATYTVDLSDVPLVRLAQVQVPLRRTHAEVVDPYRTLQ